MRNPNQLYLTKVIPIDLSFLEDFTPLMQAAAELWNACVWRHRKALATTKSEMLAQVSSLPCWSINHPDTSESVVGEFFESLRSYQRHMENGHYEIRPPSTKPGGHLRTLTWRAPACFFALDRIMNLQTPNRVISFPCGVGFDCISLPDGVVSGKIVETRVKVIEDDGRPLRIELHAVWDFGVIPTQTGDIISAYDINASCIARTTSRGDRQLIVLREALSLVQYRNKSIADFQENISRCATNSNRFHTLLSAKRRTLQNLDRRIGHIVSAATKLMVRLDDSDGVAISVVGNLKNVRRKARSGERTRHVTQKVNQIPYQQITRQQRYKSLLAQITPVLGSELYSSQTCSVCGHQDKTNRVYRGLWMCARCHTLIQADINASANILKNHLYGRCVGISFPVPLSIPEIYHWSQSMNRFEKVSPRPARVQHLE